MFSKIFNYVNEVHCTSSNTNYFCGFLTGVQSNEVGGSYHMEKEGLKRSLALLDASGVTLDCIVTDRHPQIQKFLRENNVTHYYDVWHMAKGMSTDFHVQTYPHSSSKYNFIMHKAVHFIIAYFI